MKGIFKDLDDAFYALQRVTNRACDMEEHIEQLETENQNLAEQILDLEDEVRFLRGGTND